MASSKKKGQTYALWRWYRVAKSVEVTADNIQDAAQLLLDMKYDDFTDTEALDEESIFAVV